VAGAVKRPAGALDGLPLPKPHTPRDFTQDGSGAAVAAAPRAQGHTARTPHTPARTARPASADRQDKKDSPGTTWPHSSLSLAIRVRAIAPEELRAFSGFCSGPDYTFAPSHPAAFEAWLRRYWETGRSCPEWCFVAERAGHYVAGVVYEGDARAHAVHVEHVRLPWRGDHLPLGRHLLHESLRELHESSTLDYVNAFLKTPPLGDRARSVRARLLEHAGFTLRRQQFYYVWEVGQSPDPQPRHPGAVVFRPLAEVGDDAWLDADRRIRQASLVPDMAAGARPPGAPLFPAGHVRSDEPQW
jgi:hypothetical protein